MTQGLPSLSSEVQQATAESRPSRGVKLKRHRSRCHHLQRINIGLRERRAMEEIFGSVGGDAVEGHRSQYHHLQRIDIGLREVWPMGESFGSVGGDAAEGHRSQCHHLQRIDIGLRERWEMEEIFGSVGGDGLCGVQKSGARGLWRVPKSHC